MKVLNTRNVQEALPRGLQLLDQYGERRESRNGSVLVAPWPVTTVYEKPVEKVLFWADRDANPFFHLYESLWMLAGRNDVAPLIRYVKRSIDYSDNGLILHGAYGHRWRHSPRSGEGILALMGKGFDQLPIIAQRLKENPDDRRCVLQMWDANRDLGGHGKDHPCNTTATFQRGSQGELNLVVFCRSNDIIWGAFGANAVQFSTLLEYMAFWIGCPVGTYSQISVNFHAYLDMFEKCKIIRPDRLGFIYDPYSTGKIRSIPMIGSFESINEFITTILEDADTGFSHGNFLPNDSWERVIYCVLKAHELYRTNVGAARFKKALDVLMIADQESDWIIAAQEWILRRQYTWKMKQVMGGELEHP